MLAFTGYDFSFRGPPGQSLSRYYSNFICRTIEALPLLPSPLAHFNYLPTPLHLHPLHPRRTLPIIRQTHDTIVTHPIAYPHFNPSSRFGIFLTLTSLLNPTFLPVFRTSTFDDALTNPSNLPYPSPSIRHDPRSFFDPGKRFTVRDMLTFTSRNSSVHGPRVEEIKKRKAFRIFAWRTCRSRILYGYLVSMCR